MLAWLKQAGKREKGFQNFRHRVELGSPETLRWYINGSSSDGKGSLTPDSLFSWFRNDASFKFAMDNLGVDSSSQLGVLE